MKFKGNIVITDPCYVTKDEDWDSVEDLDGYHSILSLNGVDSIAEDTGFGDGSWNVYKVEGDPYDYIKKIQELYDKEGNNSDETCSKVEELVMDGTEVIGSFCADAGMSCVADIKQLVDYNPEAQEFIDKHPWCCAVLKGFDGDITEDFIRIPGTYGYDQLVFVGKGNYNFFTF